MIRQEGMIFSTYYTKLRSVWDEIQSVTQLPACRCQDCKCDISKEITRFRDKEILYDFLMGLNEEYNTVKTQILSSDSLPTLGVALHLVSQDEQQRIVASTRHPMGEVVAFQANGSSLSRQPSRTNNQTNNRRDDRGKKNDYRWCSHCQKSGHTIDG